MRKTVIFHLKLNLKTTFLLFSQPQFFMSSPYYPTLWVAFSLFLQLLLSNCNLWNEVEPFSIAVLRQIIIAYWLQFSQWSIHYSVLKSSEVCKIMYLIILKVNISTNEGLQWTKLGKIINAVVETRYQAVHPTLS